MPINSNRGICCGTICKVFFGWLTTCVASYQELADRHGFGCVYMSMELDYLSRQSFSDFDTLRYDTQVRLMRRGTRYATQTRFLGEDRSLVEVSALLGIVKIEEALATAARPEALSQALQSRFEADEQVEASPRREMPDLIASIETTASSLIEFNTPFCLTRNQCEFADQWVFFQIPTIYEPAREMLIVKHGREIPQLKQGLRDPLKTVTIELSRPLYAFDQGFVETHAYDHDGHLACIHRICSDLPGNPVHATIVERF